MIRLSQGNPPPPLLPEPAKPLQTSWIKLLVGSSVDRVYEAGFRLYRCAEGTMPPRRLSCTSQYKIRTSDEGQLIAALRSSAHLEVDCHEFSLRLGFFGQRCLAAFFSGLVHLALTLLLGLLPFLEVFPERICGKGHGAIISGFMMSKVFWECVSILPILLLRPLRMTSLEDGIILPVFV